MSDKYEDSYCYKARYSDLQNIYDPPRYLAALRPPSKHPEIINEIMEEELNRLVINCEKALQDAEDNWEYDNQFHTCWLCGRIGFDDDMRKNNIQKWVHIQCELEMEETIKYLKY